MSGPLRPPIDPPPKEAEGGTARLDLGGGIVDLRARALVAAVVVTPRFGRENEVLAGVAAACAARADLADVSLEPRLLGPAARAGLLPVVARVDGVAAARAAASAGASVVLVPPAIATDLVSADANPVSRGTGTGTGTGHGAADRPPGDRPTIAGPGQGGMPVQIAVIVDAVGELAAARRVALELGVPLAIDVSRRSGADALAEESVAVASGCRIIRTTDVMRSRRVVEIVATLLEARRGR